MGKLAGKRGARLATDVDLEDQQRDGDSEHPIAERLQPPRLHGRNSTASARPPLRSSWAATGSGGSGKSGDFSSPTEGLLPDFRLLPPDSGLTRRRHLPGPQINDDLFHHLAGTRLAVPAKERGSDG